MYYTTNGSYRRIKMIIDYANIALTVVAGIMFVLILFLRSGSGILFPLIFLTGGTVNVLQSAKRFMDKRKLSGTGFAVTAAVLLVMSALCWATAV